MTGGLAARMGAPANKVRNGMGAYCTRSSYRRTLNPCSHASPPVITATPPKSSTGAMAQPSNPTKYQLPTAFSSLTFMPHMAQKTISTNSQEIL